MADFDLLENYAHAQGSNSQTYIKVVLVGLCILTGNDVICCLRVTENRVNATAAFT